MSILLCLRKVKNNSSKKNKIKKISKLFWTCQRPGLKLLRPNNKSSPNATFGEITRNKPLPREGGIQSKGE